MDQQMQKQFEIARTWTLEVAETISLEIADVEPDGFSNNLKWQTGHILTAAENFLFVLPTGVNHLPDAYYRWFGSGTRPSEWQGEVPDLDELIAHLRNQLERVREIPPEQMNEELEKPMFGFKTFAECTNFVVLHEALHVGKMEEMIRLIEHQAQ